MSSIYPFQSFLNTLSATKVPYTFLYHSITTDEFVSYLANHARGAAYPAVTGGDFEAAPLVVPAVELLEQYHSAGEPMHLEAEILKRKNANLRQTRDLLLPRLISGEVDVAQLHGTVPGPA